MLGYITRPAGGGIFLPPLALGGGVDKDGRTKGILFANAHQPANCDGPYKGNFFLIPLSAIRRF